MEDARLDALLDAAFAHLCAERVGAFVDVDEVLRAVDSAGTAERLAVVWARLVTPARKRVLDAFAKSELLLGAWVPAAAQQLLADVLGRPWHLPKPLVDELVASERVRDAVRQMLEESVQSVLDKTVSAAPGGRGLRSVMGLAGAAGRGILGGLGDEIQRQLQERARGFVQAGVGLMQARLAQRLVSDDTARTLGRRRRRFFLELMKRKESEAAALTRELQLDLIDSAAPSLVAHNLARAEVRALLRAELAAALAELDRQTVGELLSELGLIEQARRVWRERGGAWARRFMASPAYHAWLSSAP